MRTDLTAPVADGPVPDPIGHGDFAPEPAGDLADLVRRASNLAPGFGRLAAAVGGTPLVEVPGPPGGARIRAKLEWRNPGGSVKARTAVALLARAIVAHAPDRPVSALRILEYSGGNLAAALGMARQTLGFDLHLVLSSASPASLLRRLAVQGCEVTLVDAALGFRAVIETATELGRSQPETTFLYQHRSWVNGAAHEIGTGAEIVRQMGSDRVATWVASVGTGGTLVGVARALRAAGHDDVSVVAATPAEMPYGTTAPPDPRPRYAGSGGLGDGVLQPIVEHAGIGPIRHAHVDHPTARAGMHRFLALTGLRVGSSAAANWLVACDEAAGLAPNRTVVTVFPCAGAPEEWAPC